MEPHVRCTWEHGQLQGMRNVHWFMWLWWAGERVWRALESGGGSSGGCLCGKGNRARFFFWQLPNIQAASCFLPFGSGLRYAMWKVLVIAPLPPVSYTRVVGVGCAARIAHALQLTRAPPSPLSCLLQGVFMAAASQARRWQAEGKDAAAVEAVRSACEVAGYDVSQVCGGLVVVGGGGVATTCPRWGGANGGGRKDRRRHTTL